MSDIKIFFKDGSIREFKHEGRAGGSYSKHIKYEEAFVVIEDEWGTKTAFPALDIREIVEIPERRW
jgi:hypothetical protein